MNFCTKCGSAQLERKIPRGDNMPRYVCTQCEEIYYHNPKMVVGCIAQWEDQVLLVKRAIEPRAGYWTLPAGYMENGETAGEGAAREAREEALADTQIGMLYTHFSIPHISQVYLIYLANLTGPNFGVGEESTDAALFSEREIPWNDLAFTVMRKTLELYFDDRRAGRYRCHSGDITYAANDRSNPPRFRIASTP
ncbi:MAG: NUDIX hydrolase [Chromatiales bacterium]|nr:NUDIX hydrolase [Chromatiales bacterium]